MISGVDFIGVPTHDLETAVMLHHRYAPKYRRASTISCGASSPM
jgi:hypothetical protein